MILKNRKWRSGGLSLLIGLMLLSGCGAPAPVQTETSGKAPTQTTGAEKHMEESSKQMQLAGLSQDAIESSPLQVHFLDVGQADCTLVICDDEAMLIDGGDRDDAEVICDYLDAQGVDGLKYAIGTHPHEDHIGSLDDVLYHVEVEHLILSPAEHDTRYVRDLDEAAEDNDVPVLISDVGDVYTLGDAEFTILGPVGDYDDEWNNWSVTIRLVYGENSFIFTGDAEMEAEYDMCDTGLPMSAQVYQVGHHGSSTSSSEALMDAVRPEYAVISCEMDNEYGHPHVETMEILEEYGVSVFRTDIQGTIVAVSDGKNIIWSTAPKIEGNGSGTVSSGENDPNNAKMSYVLNTNTKKFHFADCGSVKDIQPENREEYSGSRQELIDRGYKACGSCEP